MEALTSWIGHIIILILIAAITELLIPNTNLHQYVKMVVGLLLILIMISPLLTLFSIDKQKIYEAINVEQMISDEQLLNSFNEKKNEIEVAQHAYIEEQMAVQLKNQVEEELIDQYEMTIKDITLSFHKQNNEIVTDIDVINVTLANYEKNVVPAVEKVVIGQGEQDETKASEQERRITAIHQYLAATWGLSESQIKLNLEGGER